MKLLYVVSGRSFSSKNPGRKIFSVINSFKKIKALKVDVLFGKDIIINNDDDSNSNYGAYDFHNQKIRQIKVLQFFIHSLSELKDIIHDFKLFFHLRKSNNSNLKIIWERSSRLHISSLLYAKYKKIIYVLEWKDNLLSLYGISFFKWFGFIIERWKLKYSDYIIVESEVLKKFLIDKGVSSKKIIVAYNGVDLNEFNPHKIKSPNSKFTVGYVGSYAYYHDMQRLIKAASIINKSKNRTNIEFILIGKGKDYNIIKKMIRDENLENIHLIDPVPMQEVPKWINKFDVCVLPGTTDIICPIKIMEYMACGKATILPDYGCNREVITDMHDGILFKPFNENDLAEKIIWSVNNPTRLNKIGENALSSCIEKYTWNRTWTKALKQILRNNETNKAKDLN